MWLLDANIPVQLVALLAELGVEAESAVNRGWNTLGNGSLVSAAAQAEFTALLTRDRLFGESAASALKGHRVFCIVRITLPQLRAPQFLQAFRAAWQNSRINTASGQMIEWPAP
jgi:predicted nuclease of predicted toxin-antitoxin system